MKSRRHIHLLGAALLVAGCSILFTGCLGFGGGGSSATATTLNQAQVATTVESVADASQQPIVVSPADKYSSFQSKDPFIQQAVPTTESTNSTTGTTSSSTTTSSTTTTTTSTSTSSTSTTSTSSTSTTSTSSTTSTTSFFTHMLQILQVHDANGSAAVTFQVDNNVYVDQHVGDKVSTSWGDVTVVDINVTAKTVTLLHDGQTLTMTETQVLFE
jgi:hypothetical protein